MSLLPFLIGYEQPRRLMEQDFGLALTPDNLLTATVSPLLSRDYYRPWRQLATTARDVGSSIKSDKDKFQVNLDVQHFKPEEIAVKTADGYIVVEGKHEEKQDDHGFVSRQFTRRYALPKGCNPETVESRLSSDGVLSVIAPKFLRYLRTSGVCPLLKPDQSGRRSRIQPDRRRKVNNIFGRK